MCMDEVLTGHIWQVLAPHGFLGKDIVNRVEVWGLLSRAEVLSFSESR